MFLIGIGYSNHPRMSLQAFLSVYLAIPSRSSEGTIYSPHCRQLQNHLLKLDFGMEWCCQLGPSMWSIYVGVPPADSCILYSAQDSSVQNKAWYAGSCDRRTAEAALLRFNKVWYMPPRLSCIVAIKQLLFCFPLYVAAGKHNTCIRFVLQLSWLALTTSGI